MKVIDLTRNPKFVPWYERLDNDTFVQGVVDELCSLFSITEQDAMDIYEEWCSTSIYREDCKIYDGYYSVRYHIRNKLEEIKNSRK